MFYGCNNLTNVDVSGFDTSQVTDIRGMFYGCSSLTSLDVSSFDTSQVTDMEYMFFGCSGLTSLDVSGFATGQVTDMGFMFSGCSGLTNLDISGLDTSQVTNMNSMFFGCSSLTSLDVSGFATSQVTDMYGMFYSCSSLANLDVGGLDTSQVTNMNSIFSGCSGLTSLDVSGFDTRQVTNMGYMFSGCSGLTSLDVSGFDTSQVENMWFMFSGCSGLTSLDVSGFNTSRVASINNMFSHCSGLTGIDVSGFNTSRVTSINNMFSHCSSLTGLDISSFDMSQVTNELVDMFGDCNDLSIIDSPINLNVSAYLPSVANTFWCLPDGTKTTQLPQNLDHSVRLTRLDMSDGPEITTTTPELNMDTVIRVKYVPYSYTVETDNGDADNKVTFSIVEGRLAEGLQMYPATGEIYGVPLEAGEFTVTVKAEYSKPEFNPAYAQLTLIVKENTAENVSAATDAGYEIIQPVQNIDLSSGSGGSQLFVSRGEYEEFQNLYLDGDKLAEGTDYTSEAGSTRITILNQTLTSKSAGTHTLGIEFRTKDTNVLKRAAQNFVVTGSVDSGDGDKDHGEDGGVGSGDTDQGGSAGASNGNADQNGESNLSGSEGIVFVTYTVLPGDSLWRIAARFYGRGELWRKIYEDNAASIRDPGRIRAGQQLRIYLTKESTSTSNAGTAGTSNAVGSVVTDGMGRKIYRVAPGDNLWTISRKVYGTGGLWGRIYQANRTMIIDPRWLYRGQVLVIPER